MSLEEYKKKRDFDVTPEPKGRIDSSGKQRFVIQRHQASRLHYDLRLEIDGTLKSWAVPKGPSMNPKDKRLAVQTEDHPVKYLTFQGDIPKGNYGAGHMDIWDNGTFNIYEQDSEGNINQQYRKGNLKVEFFGKKIKGKFALVKTRREGKQNHWLLIKKQDQFSTDLLYDAEIYSSGESKSKKSSKVLRLNTNTFIKPMLAETASDIFTDSDWLYEFKWDGYRMITNISGNKVDMYSRNGISFTDKFKFLLEELKSVDHNCILDGEVVVTDKKGLPQFQKLQNYDERTTEGRLMYYVFDLLHLNGHDTINLPLRDRKSLLPKLLEGLQHVVYCDHIEGMGMAFYKRAIELGMEGVIAKKADSIYSPGYRTKSWLKIKHTESTEALICGYTESDGKGKLFGSLILGQYKDNELIYIGNCGTGFSSKLQKEMMNIFAPRETKSNPFSKKINLKGRIPQWMTPSLLCEVTFSEWTKSGVLRHPVFKGMRFDKVAPQLNESKKITGATPSKSKGGKSKDSVDINGISVSFTNLDKVYWPKRAYKKYDLIDYYIKVSDTILPYLKDRPQNLHRHPNGIESQGFYQKDNEHLPEWIDTVDIYSKSADRNISYMLCNTEASLLYMANLGCIEINPWGSRTHNLDSPDYTVIDLDPSPKNTFKEIIECARRTKEILDIAGINGYCKTTGKRGLHIYLPLAGLYTYEEARNFTKLICVYVNEQLPKLTSLERAIKKRKGKIYLDFMQNRRGQTLASPYCARPVEDATVSTPVSWEEVKNGFSMKDFTIKTVPKRIENIGDIFSDVLGEGIDMEKALNNLNSI